ncbi:MAG: hypothetical protein IKV35_05465, partial [Clostridia bacterium]|nr:hypothetical protein [Clostridia bacterium]
MAGGLPPNTYASIGDWLLNRTDGRKYKKEVIVLVTCLVAYATFIAFLFTDHAVPLFEVFKSSAAFIEVLEGALHDILKLVGLAASHTGLGTGAESVYDVIEGITTSEFFINLCKLEAASFAQSTLFAVFSICFLYGKNQSVFGALEERFDILYSVNKILLYGISLLLGTMLGGKVIDVLSDKLIEKIGDTVWLPVAMFLILYIAGCFVFLIRANVDYDGSYKSRLKYTFTGAFFRQLLCKIAPESLKFTITNLILVWLFNCVIDQGWSGETALAFTVALVWWVIVKKCEDIVQSLAYYKLPYCGKNCPLSGFFCVMATISTVHLVYVIAMANYPFQPFSVEELFLTMPFLNQWVAGVSLTNEVVHNVGGSTLPMLYLVLVCTLTAQLQYVSSSFTVTLFSQVFARFAIILGCLLLVPVFSNSFLTFVAPLYVAKIDHVYMAILVAVLVYVLFVLV